MSPIPFTVIGGYLGAGKTTLLNRLLAGDHGRRLAVVVNDFGEVALDELLVSSDDGEVVALANGCVCCSAADGFAETISRIRGFDPLPDQLIVEVSGVGDPAAVAQWGRSPGFELDGVLVVADPDSVQARAADRYVGDTVLAQLRSADLVLVSRADVTPPGRLDSVAAWVAAQTKAPVVIGSDWPLEVLLGLGGEPSSRVDHRGPHPHRSGRSDRSCGQHGVQSASERLEPAAPDAEPDGRATGHAPHVAEHARHVALDFRPGSAERVDLVAWLESAPEAVVRVKGTVDSSEGRLIGQRVGARCEVVLGRGAMLLEHPPAMTVIATPGIDRAELADWASVLGAEA